MSAGDAGRSSYLDLLITTLREHEKNMDRLLEKLQKISDGFLKSSEKGESKTKKRSVRKEEDEEADSSDRIIYMKVRIDRPLEEVLEILKTLKE